MRIVIPHPAAAVGAALDLVGAVLVGVLCGVVVAVAVLGAVIVAVGAIAWWSLRDGLHRLRSAARRGIRRIGLIVGRTPR